MIIITDYFDYIFSFLIDIHYYRRIIIELFLLSQILIVLLVSLFLHMNDKYTNININDIYNNFDKFQLITKKIDNNSYIENINLVSHINNGISILRELTIYDVLSYKYTLNNIKSLRIKISLYMFGLVLLENKVDNNIQYNRTIIYRDNELYDDMLYRIFFDILRRRNRFINFFLDVNLDDEYINKLKNFENNIEQYREYITKYRKQIDICCEDVSQLVFEYCVYHPIK